MEASVFENGAYDQKVGKDDDEADRHAQTDNHIVTLAPVVADVLATLLIEKFDAMVIVASLNQFIHVEMSGGCGIREELERRETLQIGSRGEGLGWHSDSPSLVGWRSACHQLDR